MQKFDAELLAKNLNALAEVFDKKPVTAGALQAWFDVLREFPTERVMGVLLGWPKTHGKFPTPAEVWKSCNELSIEEREHKARLEKQIEPEWQRSANGARLLRGMKRMLNRPTRIPQEHWNHLLQTKKPGDIGYEYARKALKVEDRQPGEDDEPQAVNF